MRKFSRLRSVACMALLLTGCSALDIDGSASGLRRSEELAGSFHIVTYSRIDDVTKPITVYIDGDVRGWTPSTDPGVDSTIDNEMSFKLASLDESPNVLFVAAPCRYGVVDRACEGKPWKEGRVAPQVVQSMDRAIDRVVAALPSPSLHMVGYSGGGAISVLLAAQRRDVISLRTIAGNLDPRAVELAHAFDKQDDLVDPMESARWLARIPQEHLVGMQDVFVPPFVTQNFVKAIGGGACVKVVRFKDAGHADGWESIWSKWHERPVSCTKTGQQAKGK